MQLNKNKIPVLFITYNRLDFTQKTLPALIHNTQGGDIVIIDNGSNDGTVEYLSSYKNKFNLILNKKNQGLGYAFNQFMDLTEGYEYCAKVDNDTIVPKNWLENMHSAIVASRFDLLQAKHDFISHKYNSWEELINDNQIVNFDSRIIIKTKCVGGSGIIFRRDFIGGNRLLCDKGLYPFNNYQIQNKNKKYGFLLDVEVDLLDMHGVNKLIKSEYSINTGRCNMNDNVKISVIIPFIRPEGLVKCVESVHKNIGIPKENYEIVAHEDKERIGCPKVVEQLVSESKYDLVMFLADDTELEENCLLEAMKIMDQFPDGAGVVAFNDGSNVPTHWIAHKKILPMIGGQFFSTEYIHCCCDLELRDRAFDIGRFAHSEKAKIKHNHPSRKKGWKDTADEDYKRVYSDEIWGKDKQTYIRRKRERLNKIAIGFPLIDDSVHIRFFSSFSAMDKPNEYVLLFPTFPHGQWATSFADARNSLVQQAQHEGAKYLLMMDTDQVYPTDTFNKLISNMDKCDICGVRVHRRWMPFDLIFYRGTLGKYKVVEDEEAFSGRLIDVDATGTGCLLFNMEVFDKVKFPWFEFTQTNDGKPVGEDIFFCSKAREAGVKICVDTSVVVGHLTTLEINEVLYKICKQLKKEK